MAILFILTILWVVFILSIGLYIHNYRVHLRVMMDLRKKEMQEMSEKQIKENENILQQFKEMLEKIKRGGIE